MAIDHNDQLVMIYVLEEGGRYVTHTITQEAYDEVRATGVYRFWGDRDPEQGPYEFHPIFVALARIEDNYDLIAGAPRTPYVPAAA